MKADAKDRFISLLSEARQQLAEGDLSLTLITLEKAHFIGQRSAVPHAHVHILMFLVNMRMKSFGEAAGQFFFIFVGFFGSLLGIALAPNAGRFFVKNATHKEIPEELRKILSDI